MKKSPLQPSLAIDAEGQKDSVQEVIRLALEAHGTESAAIDFLTRDIARHRAQWKAEAARYEKAVQKAMKDKLDWRLIRRPRDPKSKIAVLEDAIGEFRMMVNIKGDVSTGYAGSGGTK